MSDRRNLPHQPFPKAPLVWGAPPTGDDQAETDASVIAPPPNVGGPAGVGHRMGDTGFLSSVSFAYNNLAGSVNVAFPLATRVVSQAFTVMVGVVSVTLTTSARNSTTDGVIGFFVSKDVGALTNVGKNTELMVEHLVTAGLSHSMRSGTVFADDVALKIASGQKIALYVSSAGTGFASNLLSAVVTIRYFALTN